MTMGRALRLATAAACVLSALAILPSVAPAAPVGPLSHEGRWITDKAGRVVTLHGWNMVYKVGSYRPEDAGFGANDVKFLRRHGFNTIRLGIIQNGIEPALPGPDGKPRYREGYFKSIARTEKLLSKNGIFTMLDVHQDLYNERFEGEGFPDWAVVGDAATLPAEPKQGFPANYLVMPALSRAFDLFWQNEKDAAGRPLQDSFAAMWAELARRFEGKKRVLGYNILNEPWPGTEYATCVSLSGCPSLDERYLQPFTERVIQAIRSVDQRGLIWYAPFLTFDFGADTNLTDMGPNQGFAFNMYCLADIIPGTPPSACSATYEITLDNADRQSRQTDDALLMTEYAATNDMRKIEEINGLADEHMIGWQQWHYCDCEDPTTTGTGIQSLVSDPHKPPAGDNLNREKLKVSSRPYPQVVAGTPESWSFDPETRLFELSYSTRTPEGKRLPRRWLTEIFVPPIHYHGRYGVEVEGGDTASGRGERRLLIQRDRGAKRVKVTVGPLD
jgi:endoglycosylceramidase